MHAYVHNTVATDALVIKHQAINTHSADSIFIVLDQFYAEMYLFWTTFENKTTFWMATLSIKLSPLSTPSNTF